MRDADLSSLDYYPTPPAATHALCEFLRDVLHEATHEMTCLEPAAGGGHMVDVLDSYFASVTGRDVVDHARRGFEMRDYLADGLFQTQAERFDWAITNPPFKHALEFTLNMLRDAKRGVAVLVRVAFLEGIKRHRDLFAQRPPNHMITFSRRLHMVEGRLPEPGDGSSATAYCWLIWCHQANDVAAFHWADVADYQRSADADDRDVLPDDVEPQGTTDA